MAHGDRSICVLQQIADRAANDIASADDNCVLPGKVDAALLQEDHDPFGCTGREHGSSTSLGQFPNVAHTEPINVLLVCHGRGDGMLRNVLWNG